MKPGPLGVNHGDLSKQVVHLSLALYYDDATVDAIDALYIGDMEAWDAHNVASECISPYRFLPEPTEAETEAMEDLIEKLSAICIKHAPEGYTFGERRGALGFWTAEEMDNN